MSLGMRRMNSFNLTKDRTIRKLHAAHYYSIEITLNSECQCHFLI